MLDYHARYTNLALSLTTLLRITTLDFNRLWASCVLCKRQRHLACSLTGQLSLVSFSIFLSTCLLVSTSLIQMQLGLAPLQRALLHCLFKTRIRLAVLPPNHPKVFKPRLQLVALPPKAFKPRLRPAVLPPNLHLEFKQFHFRHLINSYPVTLCTPCYKSMTTPGPPLSS